MRNGKHILLEITLHMHAKGIDKCYQTLPAFRYREFAMVALLVAGLQRFYAVATNELPPDIHLDSRCFERSVDSSN